ncbi:MAG: septal ring lytic transglycosylase RlpA family protein [Desulfovibrio sp.]|nr:septal ring lytic transglycosylase RlpA family protein [Desulfovibrio sp.]MBR5051022.1 septal ring lytic transglycosylase RlpA family protein [Desulfovibrio sp.]
MPPCLNALFRDLRTLLLASPALLLALAGFGDVPETWIAGGSGFGQPYIVKGHPYLPYASAKGFVQTGTASWYGAECQGLPTASGERYDQFGLTAAHKLLPLGTRVRVTNLKNGRSVVVRINDRGPYAGSRIIDLTRTAADRLGMREAGTARVRIASLDGKDETQKMNTLKLQGFSAESPLHPKKGGLFR